MYLWMTLPKRIECLNGRRLNRHVGARCARCLQSWQQTQTPPAMNRIFPANRNRQHIFARRIRGEGKLAFARFEDARVIRRLQLLKNAR